MLLTFKAKPTRRRREVVVHPKPIAKLEKGTAEEVLDRLNATRPVLVVVK